MSSAQGKIQEKGYRATFPILVNIADTPSYFISLKDDAGLVKAYSFVSVANYQIVGVSDTLSVAEAEYRRLLEDAGKLKEEDEEIGQKELHTVTSTIKAISSAVVGGNTAYYIMLEGNENVFIANISLNDRLPFVSVGDTLTINFYTENDEVTVMSID